MKFLYCILQFVSILFLSCQLETKPKNNQIAQIETTEITSSSSKENIPALAQEFDKSTKTIHIMVALCDNENQDIVPVPKTLGNGQDPKSNLYWGAAYGIKTYFKKSSEWKLIETTNPNSEILERAIFKHFKKDFYLVTDAYDGRFIKQTTEHFLRSSAGIEKDVLEVDNKVIGIKGNAKLVAYIGHDGLMDFQLSEQFENKDNEERAVIILACYSKSYFEPHLVNANVNPLVWTTGLMAPEAYTIHDAIAGFVNEETNEAIRLRAAQAYSKYQKCSLKAAKNLLVSE